MSFSRLLQIQALCIRERKKKHEENKLLSTSGNHGMLMALERLLHVVSVGDITSSPYCPQWELVTRKQQRNEFIHDITIRLSFLHHIKSNTTLLKAVWIGSGAMWKIIHCDRKVADQFKLLEHNNYGFYIQETQERWKQNRTIRPIRLSLRCFPSEITEKNLYPD